MMNNFRKRARLLAAVICLVLIAGCVSPVWAAEEKEETVYVMAGQDGSAKKIIVSEWLKNMGEKSLIKDYTELKEIENVKGEEAFEAQEGDGAWRAGGQDIYYQGEIQKELPVEMKVSYYLEGEKVSAKKIAGKSGQVRIRFDYKNNQRMDGVYVPFVVLTSMSLDNEKFSNIEVINGKVINDGQKSLIAGYALPGLAESLELEDADISIPDYVEVACKAEDFALGGTMSVATSSLVADLDVGKIKSIDDLKEAMDKLETAASQLSDGSMKLQTGAEQLKKGTGSLYSGTKALNEKVSQLSAGLKVAKDGSAQLQSGSKKLERGAGQLEAGATELQEGIGLVKSGMDSAISGLGQTIAGDKQVLAGLKQAQAKMGDQGAMLNDAIGAMENTIAGQEKVQQGLSEGKAGAAQLETGAGNLSKGSKELRTGLRDLTGGAKDLNTGIASAYKGSGLMEEATGQLKDGAGQVNEGAGALTTGSRDLASGIASFKSGGIDKLSAAFEGNIDKITDRLKSLQQASEEYQSFAGKKAETKGTVKFIYKTDEI